jgi:hypothetical protein
MMANIHDPAAAAEIIKAYDRLSVDETTPWPREWAEWDRHLKTLFEDDMLLGAAMARSIPTRQSPMVRRSLSICCRCVAPPTTFDHGDPGADAHDRRA